MIKILAISLGLSVAASAAAEAPVLTPRETSIPFAANGGIGDFERESDKSVLLRDRAGRWYRATFLGTCPRVGYGATLRFNTDASGTFDRFSSISSGYGNCQVGSVVRAEAPRSKGGR